MVVLRPITIHKGTVLYHGTLNILPNHYPTGSVNWFSYDPEQAKLWGVVKSDKFRRLPWLPHQVSVYTYKVKKDIPDMLVFTHYDDLTNNVWENILKQEPYNSQSPFIEDYLIAEKLCTDSKYNGWQWKSVQRQVMICRPSEFLEPIERHDLNIPIDHLKKEIMWSAFSDIADKMLMEGAEETEIKKLENEITDIDRQLRDEVECKWVSHPNPKMYECHIKGHDKRPYTRVDISSTKSKKRKSTFK